MPRNNKANLKPNPFQSEFLYSNPWLEQRFYFIFYFLFVYFWTKLTVTCKQRSETLITILSHMTYGPHVLRKSMCKHLIAIHSFRKVSARSPFFFYTFIFCTRRAQHTLHTRVFMFMFVFVFDWRECVCKCAIAYTLPFQLTQQQHIRRAQTRLWIELIAS